MAFCLWVVWVPSWSFEAIAYCVRLVLVLTRCSCYGLSLLGFIFVDPVYLILNINRTYCVWKLTYSPTVSSPTCRNHFFGTLVNIILMHLGRLSTSERTATSPEKKFIHLVGETSLTKVTAAKHMDTVRRIMPFCLTLHNPGMRLQIGCCFNTISSTMLGFSWKLSNIH